MRSKKEILEDEFCLIKFKCRSETIHTELLLDIRQLLIKLTQKNSNTK